MTYDEYKLETPEDEQYRLRRMWKTPEAECYVCGSSQKLIDVGTSWEILFICEDCHEDELRHEKQDRDPEYDPMDAVEREEWERDFGDDR